MIKNIKSKTGLGGFYIVFNGSVKNEKPGWYGLSHLMEHLVCKQLDDIMDDMQRYGISWNAYTAYDKIVFHMTGLNEHVNEFRDTFLDRVLSYTPTKEHLEHEKKIILEEYKDSFNDQISSHYLNLLRKKYGIYSAIGLRRDIENFKIEDCLAYSYMFLKKPSIIVSVSDKDFERKGLQFDSYETEYSKLEELTNPQLNYVKLDEQEDPNKISIESIIKYPKETIIGYNVIEEDNNIIEFASEVLISGLNSPLYKELREKRGLIYSIGYYMMDNVGDGSSILMLYTTTDKKNKSAVISSIQEVVENVDKYVTKERFDVVKDSIKTKIKKAAILIHDNIDDEIIDEKYQVSKIIDTVTFEDVKRVLNKYYKLNYSTYSEEFLND